jgi:hypothetical protein
MAKKEQNTFGGSLFAHPVTGQILTVLSGLSFLFLSMLLPLVGPAAAHGSGSPAATRAPWYWSNFYSFLGVLLISLLLAGAATMSKLERRKMDQSPLPYFSMGIGFLCILLLIALVTGTLAI